MNKEKFLAIMVIVLLFISITGVVNASVLTFDGLSGYNYQNINQNYGDNINAITDSYGKYQIGNGFTPNISVQYSTINNNTVYNTLDAWDNNYGDLKNVAYPTSNGSQGNIKFIADPGFKVTINSFDMAGYPHASLTATLLDIIDETGTIVWSSNNLDINGQTHSSFSPEITGNSLTIRWGTNWNIGIDNINFDQSATAVPLPGAIWMLGPSLICLTSIVKRRKKI
jgi:hypothetical protein